MDHHQGRGGGLKTGSVSCCHYKEATSRTSPAILQRDQLVLSGRLQLKLLLINIFC